MHDSMARPRSISPSSIRATLERDQAAAQTDTAKPDGPLIERADPLPRPGDVYRASARPLTVPEMTLHIITHDFSYEGFSYADLERVRLVPGEKPGSGPVLIARFNGSVVMDVHFDGRHLHAIYMGISLHRLSWVWEHPRPAEFADEAATIIRKISFHEVKR